MNKRHLPGDFELYTIYKLAWSSALKYFPLKDNDVIQNPLRNWSDVIQFLLRKWDEVIQILWHGWSDVSHFLLRNWYDVTDKVIIISCLFLVCSITYYLHTYVTYRHHYVITQWRHHHIEAGTNSFWNIKSLSGIFRLFLTIELKFSKFFRNFSIFEEVQDKYILYLLHGASLLYGAREPPRK